MLRDEESDMWSDVAQVAFEVMLLGGKNGQEAIAYCLQQLRRGS